MIFYYDHDFNQIIGFTPFGITYPHNSREFHWTLYLCLKIFIISLLPRSHLFRCYRHSVGSYLLKSVAFTTLNSKDPIKNRIRAASNTKIFPNWKHKTSKFHSFAKVVTVHKNSVSNLPNLEWNLFMMWQLGYSGRLAASKAPTKALKPD